MAPVGQNKKKRAQAPVRRVSPIKPSLQGARNWATAQVRSAGYSKQNMWRLVTSGLISALAIIFVALWLGGLMPKVQESGQNFVRARLIAAGFVIERVDVVGEGRLHKQDVKAVLGTYPGDYLFDLNLKAAQARVEDLNWVDRAVIRRLWPNRIVVEIIERKQFALYQEGGELFVVDSEGAIITNADPSTYGVLPVVIGKKVTGNMSAMQDIHALTQKYNLETKAFAYHASGRWDLHLVGTPIIVKLPRDNVEQSLIQLQALDTQFSILDGRASIIDMRLPDRLTLTPSNGEPV